MTGDVYGPESSHPDSSPHLPPVATARLARSAARSENTSTPPAEDGLLGSLRRRFFGRTARRLLEEEERVPFLARVLTVAQSLAVVLVLGHSEVPLLLGAALTVRILVGMALSVLIVTVVAADYCLVKTMQRLPVLARRNQWVSVAAYLAYALFVGLVEISTYAVVLYVLDRDPQALLRTAPLLPTTGLLFLAQVVLRAALIFWTMVQLFLTARKLPVQPATLSDHSAELLGGKALQLIAELNTEHADLPTIFAAYAASVDTTTREGTGWYTWWPFRRQAEAAASARRQRWNDLVATLQRFSSSSAEEFEARLQSAVRKQLSEVVRQLALTGELPGWAAELAPEAARRFTTGTTSAGGRWQSSMRPSSRTKKVEQQEVSPVELRRLFRLRYQIRDIRPEGSKGEWLTGPDLLRLVRQDAAGKPTITGSRARDIVETLGKGRLSGGRRPVSVAPFEKVMAFLYESGLLLPEAASWWASYATAESVVESGPVKD